MIKNNKDIPVGAIVTSDKHNTYMVAVDDAGQRGLFTKTGTWLRFNGDALAFGKNGDGSIDSIKVFDTLPPLDALSEAIKMMYTGRPATSHMATIYTSEDPAVTEARKSLATLQAQITLLNQQANDISRYVSRNTRN